PALRPAVGYRRFASRSRTPVPAWPGGRSSMKLPRASTRRWLVLSLAVAAVLAAVLAAGLADLGPAPAAAPVELTMFISAGANQGVVPREVVARYVKAHPDVEIEFWESTNAATYPKMMAAKQADPKAPLVNFGYFNVDLSNRGDTDDMWVVLDPARIPALT